MMMAQGCYRPQAAMDFWARMEKMGGGEPPQILSTHPSHHNREEKIREWLPKALEKAEASECYGTSQYGMCFDLVSLCCRVQFLFLHFFIIEKYQANDVLQQINSTLHSVALEGGNTVVAAPCILTSDCTKH